MPRNEYLDPEYQKKYRSQPKHAERQKGYKQAHREQKKKLLHEHLGDCCVFCGSTERLELDHINPKLGNHLKVKGHRGLNTSIKHIKHQIGLDNLRWLCYSCHQQHSTNQLQAAWELFISLPLYEQEKLISRL